MRIPDPKANTTTEAYLAYKAGYLEESELKPVLYEPYLHFDAWLAYWAGLTNTYPLKNLGKNLFDKDNANIIHGYVNAYGTIVAGRVGDNAIIYIPCSPSTTYTIQKGLQATTARNRFRVGTTAVVPTAGSTLSDFWRMADGGTDTVHTVTTGTDAKWLVVYCYSMDGGTSFEELLSTIQIELGSSASPYEPYTGEPEMLCDEEALVAYLSGVTDTYPEDIKDPYDVRIVGYLKHLAAKRWPEPDYPVNNEEFYLSTMGPRHTSNPTPSSDIELDTSEGKFLDLEVYGDTYQQTYSGWQMLGKDGYATPISDTSYWRSASEYTQTILGNGWARFYNGSSSAMDFGNLWVYTGSQFEASTTYTIIFEIQNLDNKGNDTFLVYAQPNNTKDSIDSATVVYAPSGVIARTDGCGWDKLIDGQYVGVFTTKSELKELLPRMWLRYVQPGGTFDLRISIIKGDHSSDWQNYAGDNWQPYVGGGTPAPNPDYPQAVNVVTGEQTVEVHGKNLLQNTLFTEPTVKGNVTITPNADGTFTLDGICNSSQWTNFANDRVYPAFDGAAGGTSETTIDGYTFSWSTSDNTSIRITHNGNTGSWGMRVTSGQVYDNTVVKYQLEENQRATSWEPYQSSTYTIDLGATELCKIGDYQDYIFKSGDDWYLHKEVRHLSLPISSMNNSDNFPGWRDIGELSQDFPSGTNTNMNPSTNSWDNIEGINIKGSGRLIWGVNNNTNVVFANRGFFGSDWTQTYWTTNYSDLIVELYYGIVNPITDTKITDNTLIGELEALLDADTYNEKTFIKVTANDPNLPALLKVEAYSY